MAVLPASSGTPPLQLPASDQLLSEPLASVHVPTTPAETTVKITELPLMETVPIYPPAMLPAPGAAFTDEPPVMLPAFNNV